ncbi:hypothetical protein SDC9_43597 [bioreactor metagenome]|uniref:DUF327 domain-containing protein n=1 Tax=bioreactor metagenome TaxID=1076179 RepID=A0A644W1L4_9ZZZZ
MIVNRIKRIAVPPIGISAAKSAGGEFSGFQQQFGKQMKEDYKNRINALFDEIVEESPDILDHIDMPKFEKYRRLIRELLSEVLNNSYDLNLECICDPSGKQRIYALVNIIDQKMDDIAKDILSRSAIWLRYISHIDEIRGLIMDLFL